MISSAPTRARAPRRAKKSRVRELPHGRFVLPLGRVVVVRVPIRLVSEANTRENRFAKAARIAEQRRVTRLCLDAFSLRPPAPTPKLVVTIVRLLGPHAMRFDQGGNRQGAAKAVQDEIADWLGIDDRHEDLVRYDVLEQRAAAHGIRIEIRSHP